MKYSSTKAVQQFFETLTWQSAKVDLKFLHWQFLCSNQNKLWNEQNSLTLEKKQKTEMPYVLVGVKLRVWTTGKCSGGHSSVVLSIKHWEVPLCMNRPATHRFWVSYNFSCVFQCQIAAGQFQPVLGYFFTKKKLQLLACNSNTLGRSVYLMSPGSPIEMLGGGGF